jgi:hypothetical protein
MSLTFGANTSDTATKTSPTGITALTAFSIIQWVNITTLATGRNLFRSGGSTAGAIAFQLSGTGGNVTIIQTATVNSGYITNDTPLSATGTWVCIATTHQHGTAIKIFAGTLTTALAERTYGTTTLGSGTITADSGTVTAQIGNRVANNQAIVGRFGLSQVYNRILSLGELQAIQFDQHMGTGCVGHWRMGDTGTTTATDFSGTGNSLTITGATQSDNPPLQRVGRRSIHAPYAIAAATVPFRPYYFSG